MYLQKQSMEMVVMKLLKFNWSNNMLSYFKKLFRLINYRQNKKIEELINSSSFKNLNDYTTRGLQTQLIYVKRELEELIK